MTTVAEQLAAYVCALDPATLPPPVVERTKTAILDTLGVLISGGATPVADAARNYITLSGGTGRVRLVPVGGVASYEAAAFAMGVYAFSENYADTSLVSVAHCSSVVIPVLLATAGVTRVSGREAIAATVAGYEVMERPARALNGGRIRMGHQMRGFRPTATCGAFGAVATASRLLGMDQAQTACALTLATDFACGLRKSPPSPTGSIRIQSGTAARAGVGAVLLTQAGVRGFPTAFEDETGFINAYGADESALQVLTDRLGAVHLIEQMAVKWHCTPHNLAPSVDAVLQLQREHGLSPELIERVTVRVPSPHFEISGRNRGVPSAPGGVGIGYHYCIAVALATGSFVSPDKLAPRYWEDPVVRGLMERVEVNADAGLDTLFSGSEAWPAEVEVRTKAGASHRCMITHPKGSPENPCTPEELNAKFDLLAARFLDPGRAAAVKSIVRELESVDDISELLDLLTPGSDR